MEDRKRSRYLLHRIFGLLTIAVMILIFFFSAQNGEESSDLSDGFLHWLLLYLTPFLSDAARLWLITWIRKVAHFTAYCALGFVAAGWRVTARAKDKVSSLSADSSAVCLTGQMGQALSIAVAYAFTDEFHQIFVPGRAGRLFDVGIDSLGAISGICILLLLRMLVLSLWKRLRKQREQ